MDARLKHMSSFIVAGPSLAGKTKFVESLLVNRHKLFDVAPRKIHWFSSTFYEAPEELRKDLIFYQDISPCEEFNMVKPHDAVVLDDLMQEIANSKAITNLFTRHVHHKPCTVISITQNLFQAGKETRTRSLNAQYLVLFKSPRDASQIDFLGRQMYPGDKKFLTEAFRDATASRPHGYLFIDLNQSTPEVLRVRTRILPSEYPTLVYLPKSLHYKQS